MRTMFAFYAAPFAVPVALTAYYTSIGMPEVANLLAPIGLIVAYAGTFVFGVPVYLFLRAHNVTSFWIAPVVGFLAGGVLMLVILGPEPAVDMGGPLGALVGTFLWLIARPDRRAKPR